MNLFKQGPAIGSRCSGPGISRHGSILLLLTSFLTMAAAVLSGAEAASMDETRDCPTRYREDVGSAELFPPACVGPYIIGMPYYATDPNAYTGLTDPDENPDLRRGFYGVSCSAAKTGDIEVFLGWKDGPAGAQKRWVTQFYSLGVLYFLEDGKQQFIYGTIATDRAKSDGLPIITHTSDWVCELHKS